MDVEDLFAKPKEGFANKSLLETIAALQRHINHNGVLVEGIHRLVTLTEDAHNARVAAVNGLDVVVSALQIFYPDPRLVVLSCCFLGNLGYRLEDYRERIEHKEQAVGTVVRVLPLHLQNSSVCCYAAYALAAWASLPGLARLARPALGDLARAVVEHISDGYTVANLCKALRKILPYDREANKKLWEEGFGQWLWAFPGARPPDYADEIGTAFADLEEMQALSRLPLVAGRRFRYQKQFLKTFNTVTTFTLAFAETSFTLEQVVQEYEVITVPYEKVAVDELGRADLAGARLHSSNSKAVEGSYKLEGVQLRLELASELGSALDTALRSPLKYKQNCVKAGFRKFEEIY